MKKTICLNGLENMLSIKEMKNIIGGSMCCLVERYPGIEGCAGSPPSSDNYNWECYTNRTITECCS